MSKAILTTEMSKVEFLLDLPQEMVLKAIISDGDIVKLVVETELDLPQNARLVYDADEYGNIGLVGIDE